MAGRGYDPDKPPPGVPFSDFGDLDLHLIPVDGTRPETLAMPSPPNATSPITIRMRSPILKMASISYRYLILSAAAPAGGNGSLR
ncbi:MAG: hypothetical protein NTY86_22055 [Deltaproteobacteria bacterium]|nr:hypothetical protein [Deltaproteobacteria bacterium]